MDNIIFERLWKDSNIIELKVMASSEYINVFQSCYVEDVLLENAADKLPTTSLNNCVPATLSISAKSNTGAFGLR